MAVSLREAPARKSFNNAVSSGASGAGAGDVARALSEGVAVFCATAETESIPEMRKLQMADFTLQIWRGSILKQFCSWCRSLLATNEYIGTAGGAPALQSEGFVEFRWEGRARLVRCRTTSFVVEWTRQARPSLNFATDEHGFTHMQNFFCVFTRAPFLLICGD